MDTLFGVIYFAGALGVLGFMVYGLYIAEAWKDEVRNRGTKDD